MNDKGLKREWIKKVLGFDIPFPAETGPDAAAEVAEAEPAAAGGAAAQDDLASRLEDLSVQVSLIPGPARATLTKQLQQVRVKPDPEALDALETALAHAAAAIRVTEARRQAGNIVTSRILQKQWIAAEDSAQKALAQLADALVNDPDLQDDKQFAELSQQARTLSDLLPEDGGKLIIALGEVDDANDTTRSKALAEARTALADYRRDLDGVHEPKALQAIAVEEYGIPPFFEALQTSLADLDRELAKRT